MAERLEASFDVPGVPPAAVFAWLVDPANGPRWASFADEIRASGPPGVGQQVEARVGLLGVTFGVDTTVTTWDEPTAYALGGGSPFRGEIGARLEPLDDGASTRVHPHLELDPGRFFPVPGVVLRKALRRQFDKDVGALRDNLRALA